MVTFTYCALQGLPAESAPFQLPERHRKQYGLLQPQPFTAAPRPPAAPPSAGTHRAPGLRNPAFGGGGGGDEAAGSLERERSLLSGPALPFRPSKKALAVKPFHGWSKSGTQSPSCRIHPCQSHHGPRCPYTQGGLTRAQTSAPNRTPLRPWPKTVGTSPRPARRPAEASSRCSRAAAAGTAAQGSHRGAETRPGYLRADAGAARRRNGCTPPGGSGRRGSPSAAPSSAAVPHSRRPPSKQQQQQQQQVKRRRGSRDAQVVCLPQATARRSRPLPLRGSRSGTSRVGRGVRGGQTPGRDRWGRASGSAERLARGK